MQMCWDKMAGWLELLRCTGFGRIQCHIMLRRRLKTPTNWGTKLHIGITGLLTHTCILSTLLLASTCAAIW